MGQESNKKMQNPQTAKVQCHSKKLLSAFFTALFLMYSLPTLYAQDGKTVRGNVMDSAGDPLPGVTIVIKNTFIGTATDIVVIIKERL